MRKSSLIVAAVLLSSVAQSQEDTTAKSLDDVVVTASKFPQKQKNVGKVITVITQQQLQRASGRSLGDVLNMQSGIFVNGAQNTLGTNLDVYVRGAGTGKTLILIDGIPVYDPSSTSTAFDLNLIPVNQIERVEILKGSHSTLYGSDAIAGVINIITKKGAGKPLNIAADLSAGSFDTYKGSVGLFGKAANTGYSVRYTKVKSNGFSMAEDKDGTGKFDRDGFDQDALAANLNHNIGNNLAVRLNGLRTNNETELDAGAFTDEKDYVFINKTSMAGAGLDYLLGKNGLHFNYNYSKVKRKYRDDSTSVGGFAKFSEGSYEGGSHFAEIFGNFELCKYADLLVGVDYRNQNTAQSYLSISSFGPYKTALGKDSAALKQFGTYASVIFKNLGGFNIEAGARFNSFNKYGNVVTFSFNPSYLINDKVKLFANLSSGFKAPTLYQLYSEYRNTTTELKPEKSLSFDAGVQYQKENVDLRAVYFRRNIKDNIVFYSEGAPTYRSYYINTDKQNDQGVELESSMTFDQWHLALNYTNVTGKVETKVNGKDTTFNNLFRRPQNTINLNIGYDVTKKLYTSIGLRSVSKRYEPVFGSSTRIELDPYYTWNAYVEYRFVKQVKAFVDLKNLTDEKYIDVYGYNSRRFNFMAGVNLNF